MPSHDSPAKASSAMPGALCGLLAPDAHIKTGDIFFTQRTTTADEGNSDAGQLELMSDFGERRHGGGHQGRYR